LKQLTAQLSTFAKSMSWTLIACIDGLSGFPEAIRSVFPKTNI